MNVTNFFYACSSKFCKAALILDRENLEETWRVGVYPQCLLTDILIFGYVERSGVGVWAYGFGRERPNVN